MPNSIMSENQSAFIPGRYITDNVLIAHELIHSLHTRKCSQPYMALKLDISKAFDRVEWRYLNEIMRRMGFCEKWRAIPTPAGDVLSSQDLVQNLDLFLRRSQEDEYKIFPFLLWRIWKMRNSILFQNKRYDIPHIINQAYLDWKLWEDAKKLKEKEHLCILDASANANDSNKNIAEPDRQGYYCLVDASWTSAQEKAGISWVLYKDGQEIIKATSSIEATKSPLEAEASALRMAVAELRKLGYISIIFKGDAKALYDPLSKPINPQIGILCDASISIYVNDISNLSSSCNYSFVQVPRSTLLLVDMLAKNARKHKTSYVIKWTGM